MSDHEHDVEDLDVTGSDAQDVKGGSLNFTRSSLKISDAGGNQGSLKIQDPFGAKGSSWGS